MVAKVFIMFLACCYCNTRVFCVVVRVPLCGCNGFLNSKCIAMQMLGHFDSLLGCCYVIDKLYRVAVCTYAFGVVIRAIVQLLGCSKCFEHVAMQLPERAWLLGCCSVIATGF